MDEVELVEDEPVEDLSRNGRARRISGRTAGAGVLALVAGGLVTVVVTAEPRPDDTVGVIAGAAPSLTSPLTETWRVETPEGWSLAGDLLMTAERQGAGVQVVAHDLTTGAELWQVVVEPAPGSVACTAQAEGPDGAVVVCQALGGLAPSGRPGQDVAQDPGRILLVSAQDGGPAGEIRLPPNHAGYDVVDGDLVLMAAGWSALDVERRDLVTGRTVWTADLALEPVLDGDREVAVELPAPRVRAQAGDVLVTGPVAALLDGDDGAAIGVWRPEVSLSGDVGFPRVTTTPGGLGVQIGADTRPAPTSWYTAAGDLVGTFDGTAAEPLVTDGSESDVVLSSTPWWGSLRAVDVALGEVLWSVRTDQGRAVLRVRGTVVLAHEGRLQAVDVRTGERHWVVSADGVEEVHAVSDGAFVLGTGPSPGGAPSVSAISVADGSLLWRTAMPVGGQDLEVLDGRVVAVGPGVLIGLG